MYVFPEEPLGSTSPAQMQGLGRSCGDPIQQTAHEAPPPREEMIVMACREAEGSSLQAGCSSTAGRKLVRSEISEP
jgi:hypothetical protein